MNKGTCIHYNVRYNVIGFVGKPYRTMCCEAGVNYLETFGGCKEGIEGIALRMPCIEAREKSADRSPGTFFKPGQKTILIPIDRKGHSVITCPFRQEPTDEQAHQYRVKANNHMEKTKLAIKIASAWKVFPKPDKDRSEVITCPACGGKLHIFQSSHNGHASGQCETEGCIRWLE